MSIVDEPHLIIKAVLVRSSEKAWLLQLVESEEEVWIPKSQGEWQSADTWAITRWIADQKGIS